MKIWIIYDSVHGHCKKLGETLGDLLEGRGEVSVGYAKRITPADVISDAPDAVLVGGPVHFGRPSRCITSWIKRCHQSVNKAGSLVRKGGAFYTWQGKTNNDKSWRFILQKYPYAGQFFDQVLPVRVFDKDSPLKIAENVHVYSFVEDLKHFLFKDNNQGTSESRFTTTHG